VSERAAGAHINAELLLLLLVFVNGFLFVYMSASRKYDASLYEGYLLPFPFTNPP